MAAARKRKKEKRATSQEPRSVKDVAKSNFEWKLWLLFCVENWVLDFGRPIFALIVSANFPLSLPSIGDYCHMLYNVITALVLIALLQSSVTAVPKLIQNLLVIFFVMGSSIHLVGDSFDHRLIHCGYQLHLSVRNNPIIKNLSQPCLTESFELMYFYDEHLGHLMWYIPLYCIYIVYFYGCFSRRKIQRISLLSLPYLGLILASAVYQWYLVTEGQLIEIYLISCFVMAVVAVYHTQRGSFIDSNGVFLLVVNFSTLLLVGVWCGYLWNDAALRMKYPGLLYVPEPWSYWSLYHMSN